MTKLPKSWPTPFTLLISRVYSLIMANTSKTDSPMLALNLRRTSGRNLDSPLSSPGQSPVSPVINQSFINPDCLHSPKSCDKSTTDTDGSKIPTSKKLNKKTCPCRSSSQGQAWLLTCKECKQCWHNSCANLKGSIPKQAIESILKTWICPWCWTCPFPKTANHKSNANDDKLLSETMASSIVQNVTDKLTESFKTSIQPYCDEKVAAIEDQIKTLTKELTDFKNRPSWTSSFPEETLELSIATLTSDERPILDDRQNYLPGDELDEIQSFLKSCNEQKKFKNKNGRSTLCFGEQYAYTGSHDQPESTEIPDCLKRLIQKVKVDYELSETMTPNSVLINHYPKKSNPKDCPSSLPSHSDNEMDTQSGSCISTYSVGAPRPITFSAIHSEETDSHIASHNSMYVMTRASQAWYKHMMMDVDKCDERFSITLRSVKSQNKKSLVLIGDSNTKPVKFGCGKGTIGESYPGRRVKAAKISNINPADCCEYANAIIACGTNDLRLSEVDMADPGSYVHTLVNTLREKLEQIKLLSPKTNVIFMPVLPTRDAQMNHFIQNFNTAVFNSDFRKRLGVTMPPIYSFLDKKQLLSLHLTRDSDSIHLGGKGISMFVRIMKEAIFHCRKTGQGNYREPGSGPKRPP